MDLSIVVPAYNEAARITATARYCCAFMAQQGWVAELIIVDDGSVDGTRERIRELGDELHGVPVRSFSNAVNRGKGYSVRRGMMAASGRVIGFVDADDKTDIEGLTTVMGLLDAGVDGVIGDRTLRGSEIIVGRRPYRELGSHVFRYLVHRWMGLPDFPDTQCGFKFFRGDVARELFGAQQVDGFMFDVEILLLAAVRGYEIRRIPVLWRDDPDSRFRPFSGTVRNLRELFEIRRRIGSPEGSSRRRWLEPKQPSPGDADRSSGEIPPDG